MRIVQSDDDVNDVLQRCDEAEENGATEVPGMTYEQGIAAAIRWITGQWSDHPLDQ